MPIPKGFKMSDVPGWKLVETPEALSKLMDAKGLKLMKIKNTKHYIFAKNKTDKYDEATIPELLERLGDKFYIAETKGYIKIFKYVKVE
jgi:hypothetical protein